MENIILYKHTFILIILILIIILTILILNITIKKITNKLKIYIYKNTENKESKSFFLKNNINNKNEFDILKRKNIFTKYELIFFNELKILLKNTNYILLSKVRIADIVETKKNVNYSDFLKIFNKINRKHIDFLITDQYGNILILIELDGLSHKFENTKKNDNLKEKLSNKLNIPLIRYKNSYKHNLEKIKELLFL